MADGDSGVSNLEKSAFWIYGVTAMIMREPLGTLLRHASTAGLGDPLVRDEILRVAVVLAFLSRLFLAAGLHFEIVYMRPGGEKRYPRRSYPVDFLAGLIQLLVGVAASTVVSLHAEQAGGTELFNILASLFLLADQLWLGVTALLRFSAVKEVARRAKRGLAILFLSFVLAVASRFAGADAALADEIWLGALLVLSSVDAAVVIRNYGRLDGVPV
jgi:hypothetical protein